MLVPSPLVNLPEPVHLPTGEIIFVPGGLPHSVHNLSPSLAVSVNYIDSSNLERSMTSLGAEWCGIDEALAMLPIKPLLEGNVSLCQAANPADTPWTVLNSREHCVACAEEEGAVRLPGTCREDRFGGGVRDMMSICNGDYIPS